MIIGRDLKHLRQNKITAKLIDIFGTLDLHSQIRLKPVINFCRKNFTFKKELNILELGCGEGILGYEIIKINKNIHYTGIDINEDSILNANYLRSILNCSSQVNFICQDINKLVFDENLKKIDMLLLVDFIEHIKDPLKVLNKLKYYLKENSIIIISVPTSNYIKYFGSDFNTKVGHVNNKGFNIEEIKQLLNDLKAKLVMEKYNTGFISNIGCALFYRFIFNNKYVELTKSLLLYLFKYFDFINNHKVSCSLFAVFSIRKCTTI